MPRKPKPRLHKGYYVTEAGGQYRRLCPETDGPEVAARELDRLISARGGNQVSSPATGPTLRDVFGVYLDHCRTYYRLPSGEPSREQESIPLSWRELLAADGDRPAASLDKGRVKAAVAAMVTAGLSRKVVNQRLGRIKRGLAWLAEEGHLPEAVAASANMVRPLPEYRSAAKERKAVAPVDPRHVEATLPHLPAQYREMVRLMQLTGMRPGEVLMLEVGMLAPDPARPGAMVADFGDRHKMAYRKKARRVHLPPSAVAVIADRLAVAVAGGHRWVWRSKRTGGRLIRSALIQAVTKGAVKAGVPHWHPNQLRHRFATDVRATLGLDAAQVLLGHSRADVTQVYAEVEDSRRAGFAAKLD